MSNEATAPASPTEAAIDRELQILELAREQFGEYGAVEFDDDATVSEGDGNGAYVQAWVWVDFTDTKLDKEPE